MTQTNQATSLKSQPLSTNNKAIGHARMPQFTGELNAYLSSQRASPPEPSLIPREIYAEIFLWYAASWCTFRVTAPSASAWILGHVCREWRDLALSMPQLWNHPPVIHITLKSLKDGHFRECWKEFLLRSGTLPLKLHLSFEIPVGTTLERPGEILVPFFDHVNRWEHLTISGLSVLQAQVQFSQISGRLSLLRSVTFNFAATTSNSAYSPYFDIFEFAPNLAHINLHSPSPSSRKSRLRFPWDQLTSYRETGIDMGTFPVVLHLSQPLETLQYRGRNFTHSFMEGIIQFRLRHLIIETREIKGFWRQLQDVTLPALETFSVRALQHTLRRPPQIPMLTDLIVRSGCLLKKLVLDFSSGPFDDVAMKDLLSHVDGLESLELGDCYGPYFNGGTIASLIFREDKKTLLPHLRFLTLHNRGGFDAGSIISRLALSREKVVSDDTNPGRLLAPLEYLRIVTPNIYYRHESLCKMITTVSATQSSFSMSPTTDLSPVGYIHVLLELVQKSCRHMSLMEVTPELISVFVLAYFVEDAQILKDTLHVLEKLGVLSLARSHLIRHRWIPGCKEDILYVHPNHHDAATAPELWEAIGAANLDTLESFLGYQLANKREDDLKDFDDSL